MGNTRSNSAGLFQFLPEIMVLMTFASRGFFPMKAQDIRQNLPYTDSCQSCQKRVLAQVRACTQTESDQMKLYQAINDSIRVYTDSIKMSYDWQYKGSGSRVVNQRLIWQKQADAFQKQITLLGLQINRLHQTRDSLIRLSRPRYNSLEVFDKKKSSDTLALLEQVKLRQGLDLSFKHPRLQKSRINNLKTGDSVTFYFFTWATIKGHWTSIEQNRNHQSYSHSREEDVMKNADLSRGVYPFFDSLGYSRVWFLRKVTLVRTPCYWLISGYRDILFKDAELAMARTRFDSMMHDGKERFDFRLEAIYADCLTNDRIWEFHYPVNFARGFNQNGDFIRFGDIVWRLSEHEMAGEPVKGMRTELSGAGSAKKDYHQKVMSNHCLIRFSDGSTISRYLPFWFYIRKYYSQTWFEN